MDQYDSFKSLNPIRDAFRRPIEWWHDHVDENPTISQMGLDFFPAPAMSAECERILQSCKADSHLSEAEYDGCNT